VDVVEPDERRHALARALGARAVLRPEAAAAATDAADDYAAGFECSARNDAFALLQTRLAANGRLCVLSDGNNEPLTLTPAFHEKELRIAGSTDGWDYQQHAAWYFDSLRRTPTPLAGVFQLEVAAEDLAATFERLARREVTPVKVLVRYGSSQPGTVALA
jgi:alcohol dehydrogenase